MGEQSEIDGVPSRHVVADSTPRQSLETSCTGKAETVFEYQVETRLIVCYVYGVLHLSPKSRLKRSTPNTSGRFGGGCRCNSGGMAGRGRSVVSTREYLADPGVLEQGDVGDPVAMLGRDRRQA